MSGNSIKEMGRWERGWEKSKDDAKKPSDSCDSAQAVATVCTQDSCPISVCGVELETSLESASPPPAHLI